MGWGEDGFGFVGLDLGAPSDFGEPASVIFQHGGDDGRQSDGRLVTGALIRCQRWDVLKRSFLFVGQF